MNTPDHQPRVVVTTSPSASIPSTGLNVLQRVRSAPWSVVESPLAALRQPSDAAKRFRKVGNATAVICKALMIAQKRFWRLYAPELLKDLYHGAEFVDGVAIKQDGEAAA